MYICVYACVRHFVCISVLLDQCVQCSRFVAVCCNVLQCVALCCNVFQCVACVVMCCMCAVFTLDQFRGYETCTHVERPRQRERDANTHTHIHTLIERHAHGERDLYTCICTHANVLYTTHSNAQQRTATHSSAQQRTHIIQCTVRCCALQHTATHSTHCNKLQHNASYTAMHCALLSIAQHNALCFAVSFCALPHPSGVRAPTRQRHLTNPCVRVEMKAFGWQMRMR